MARPWRLIIFLHASRICLCSLRGFECTTLQIAFSGDTLLRKCIRLQAHPPVYCECCRRCSLRLGPMQVQHIMLHVLSVVLLAWHGAGRAVGQLCVR